MQGLSIIGIGVAPVSRSFGRVGNHLELRRRLRLFSLLFLASSHFTRTHNLLERVIDKLGVFDRSLLGWHRYGWRHINRCGLDDSWRNSWGNDCGREVLSWPWRNLEAVSLSHEFIFLQENRPFLVVEAWVKYLEGLFELLLDFKEKMSEMSGHCIF